MQRTIVYYDQAGKHNTDTTLKLARRRSTELGVKHVIVASTTGFTARRALTEFAGTDIRPIVVGSSRDEFDPQLGRELLSQGCELLFWDEQQATYPDVVAHSYRKLCEGMKVAVEIASLAVDAGLVPTGEEVVVIAGTGPIAYPPGGGADTALVMTPGPLAELAPDYTPPLKPERRRVREILCKPR